MWILPLSRVCRRLELLYTKQQQLLPFLQADPLHSMGKKNKWAFWRLLATTSLKFSDTPADLSPELQFDGSITTPRDGRRSGARVACNVPARSGAPSAGVGARSTFVGGCSFSAVIAHIRGRFLLRFHCLSSTQLFTYKQPHPPSTFTFTYGSQKILFANKA